MADELRPALLILERETSDGDEERRAMFFESHHDALATLDAFKDEWKWSLEMVEVYRAGEHPQPAQPRLF